MKYLRLFTLPAAGRHLMRTSSLTRHFLVGFLSVLITLVAAPVSVQAARVNSERFMMVSLNFYFDLALPAGATLRQ